VQIVIEDGKPVVKLKVSEARALVEAARLCGEFAEWLKDEQATTARDNLLAVADRYVKKETVDAA
jgi:hypothetical protein